MYLLYLDESGSVMNPNERHFVLAGIAVPDCPRNSGCEPRSMETRGQASRKSVIPRHSRESGNPGTLD